VKSDRRPQRATLGDLLRATLVCAQATVFGDRVALYLVQLTDAAGFALAAAIHAKIDGPDPAVLRARALERDVRAPLMAGAAPVEMLARIVEALPDVGHQERRSAVQLIRAIHKRGAVPVLVVDEGSAAASPLETWTESNGVAGLWGWERPIMADA
jgi:hypothetical protein